MISLPQQPQSIGKVLDTGFKLYTQSLNKTFLLAAIPAVVSSLPYLFTGILSQRTDAIDISNPGMLIAIIIFAIAIVVISLTFYNAMIIRIWGIATDKDPGFSESIALGLGFFAPVLFGTILYILAILLGFILLLIPGLILSLSLMFYSALIVIKGEKGLEAIKHSHKLVWGNWWRTLAILTIPGIIAIILFTVASFGEITLLAMSDIGPQHEDFETTFNFYYSLINIILNGLIMPMYVSVLLANLSDLMLRKEGSDLHQRIDAAIEST